MPSIAMREMGERVANTWDSHLQKPRTSSRENRAYAAPSVVCEWAAQAVPGFRFAYNPGSAKTGTAYTAPSVVCAWAARAVPNTIHLLRFAEYSDKLRRGAGTRAQCRAETHLALVAALLRTP
jgi:hypothetical protein